MTALQGSDVAGTAGEHAFPHGNRGAHFEARLAHQALCNGFQAYPKNA